MIAKNSSIANVLDNIISKIELELEQEDENESLYTSQSTLQDITESKDKSSKLSHDSMNDVNCRICYDPNQEFPITYPCKCKGTMGAIHLKCLEKWLEESNRNSCELCGYEFRVERTPRHKVFRSIIIWLCLSRDHHQIYIRNVKTDLLRCFIITPVTIASSYICVVAADFYAMNNFDNFPPARWTTYSLLSMITLLILSYFVWVYIALQYHQKTWFYWWQKTSIVKIIDFTPGNVALVSNKYAVSEV